VLAAAATVLSALYMVAYLWAIEAQNGAVVWWYLAVVLLATLSCASAAAGILARAALAVGLITSALSTVVALLSLGILLAPTVAATAIALVLLISTDANQRAATDRPRPSPPRMVIR
jgi:hypothetical protein